jgi:diguanylate cyclase (GGDEF)-like protein
MHFHRNPGDAAQGVSVPVRWKAKNRDMFRKLVSRLVGTAPATPFGKALIEERYWSLRKQVPVVYLLGFVNVSGLELSASGSLSIGLNLPTFIALCGMVRLYHWFGPGKRPRTHAAMAKRLEQTVWFAFLVCIAVCARCLGLIVAGSATVGMAAMLFGGLTAIGVAFGLIALPAAASIPLILIIVPVAIAGFLAGDRHITWAAFGLVVVSAVIMRLLDVHSRHFAEMVRSRWVIAHEQKLAERAHREAVVAATTDFLTGLPNRRAFVAALEAEISDKVEDGTFAVAILDLDRFKFVNDTFGHAAGDELLREVASRLTRAVGDRGLVARLGGDEFGLLLPGTGHGADAQATGARILKQVNRPVTIDGRELSISACCGFALSRRIGEKSPSRLMANADLALYQAKENPSGGLALFEHRMEAPRRRRALIERALRLPGVESNFHLVFQPIVRLDSGEIIANEALARWTDPELGAVGPCEFVPIAEQLNLIDIIDRHLMGQAFEAARGWPPAVKLSFNLSAIQLCTPRSARAILKALATAGLPPERLQAEVTETALLMDFRRAGENLSELRRAGVTIALDDFGAGYASIGYLRELHFDQIKLDGALVTAAQQGSDGKRLLRAVIGLCEILGVSSVAEHVESEDLLRVLVELGCTAGQGFWLHPPAAGEIVGQLSSIGVAMSRDNKEELRAA